MTKMMMTTPRNTHRSLLNELMSDPFDAFFNMPAMPAQKMAPTLMRTDIKETPTAFELTIDLPGFKKEDVKIELKDGNLQVSAETRSESSDSDDAGTFVRKERFSGKCSRTFYAGDDIEEDEIRARFENGVLSITVPKKQEQPKLEASKSIAID